MSDRLTLLLEVDFHAEEFAANPDLDVRVLEDRPDELSPDDLRGAEAFVSASSRLTADSLAGVEDLGLAVRLGAGYDNIDVDACTEHGVLVSHLPQFPTEAVAQMALGAMIACAHNLRAYDRRFRDAGWTVRGEFTGTELAESTVGVLGLGRIGSRVVELLDPFDPEVLVHDPYADPDRLAELGADPVDLDGLLDAADLLTIHVPLTDETEGMLGADAFRRMKDSAYLINTARGGIYPDEELAAALRTGELAGAAIDVYENEGDADDNPLLDLDEEETVRCLFTPHMSSVTEQARERQLDLTREIVEAFAAGEVPPNVLNPEAIDRRVPEGKRSPSFQP